MTEALDPDALHRDATVVLGYCNPAMRTYADHLDATWFLEDDPIVQGSLPRYREGGVDAIVLSVGAPIECTRPPTDAITRTPGERLWEPVFPGAQSVQFLLRALDALHAVIDGNPDRLGLALKAEDVPRLNAEGRIAIFLHLTGAWINGDLAVLRTYHRLGVRGIHLVVEGLPEVGDGANDAPVNGGLSPLGRDIVREMDRLGMVVDVSHASEAATWDILEVAKGPVVASHSCARVLCDINRNLWDDQLKAIAETGGVVGVHFSAGMACQEYLDKLLATPTYDRYYQTIERLRARYPDPWEFMAHRNDPEEWKDIPGAAGAAPPAAELPTLDVLLDQIDYLVNLIGVDHVGLGPDYDIGDPPLGVEHAGKMRNFTEALIARGYAVEDLRKILGDNWLRVYRRVLGG
jgi:membrane dipeptidase